MISVRAAIVIATPLYAQMCLVVTCWRIVSRVSVLAVSVAGVWHAHFLMCFWRKISPGGKSGDRCGHWPIQTNFTVDLFPMKLLRSAVVTPSCCKRTSRQINRERATIRESLIFHE